MMRRLLTLPAFQVRAVPKEGAADGSEASWTHLRSAVQLLLVLSLLMASLVAWHNHRQWGRGRRGGQRRRAGRAAAAAAGGATNGNGPSGGQEGGGGDGEEEDGMAAATRWLTDFLAAAAVASALLSLLGK